MTSTPAGDRPPNDDTPHDGSTPDADSTAAPDPAGGPPDADSDGQEPEQEIPQTSVLPPVDDAVPTPDAQESPDATDAPDAQDAQESHPDAEPDTDAEPDPEPVAESEPVVEAEPAPEAVVEPGTRAEDEPERADPEPGPEVTQVVDLTDPAPPTRSPDDEDDTVVVLTDATVREPGEDDDPGATPTAAPETVPAFVPPAPVVPASAPAVPGDDDVDVTEGAVVDHPLGTGLLDDIPGGWQATRRRRRRQTVTFAVALLGVLGIGALAVLMYTGRVPWPFGGRVNTAQVCTPGTPLPPKKIRVRVFNGSDRAGLARQVGQQLKKLGFTVLDTGNDPLGTPVTAPVELRYGDFGETAGKTTSAYVKGKVTETLDDRFDETVDVVLGQRFARLNTPKEVTAALAGLQGKLPLSCPPGVTPPPSPTPSVSPSAKPSVKPSPKPSPKKP